MALYKAVILHFFYLLTSFGFFYQIGNILDEYLEYETTTRLTVGIPETLRVPDLSACIVVSDVFDYDRYNRDHNTNLENVNSSDFDAATVLVNKVNLNALFNYTPAINSYVTECRFRQPKAFDYELLHSSNCMKYFTIRKYFLQEYMCYWIGLSIYENSTYVYSDIAYADSLQGMFYTISFSGEHIKRTSFMRLFLHPAFADEPNDYPDTGTAYSVDVFRAFNNLTGVHENNYYTLIYNNLINYRLRKPYHPHCIDYTRIGFNYRSDCLKSCLNNLTIDRFNKMPYPMIIPGPSTFQVISGYDVVNRTRAVELYALNVKCNHLCQYDDCTTISMLTKVRVSKFGSDMLTFRVNIPREPDVVVQFMPRITLTEFVIYLFSCFSTWYGISIIDSRKVFHYFNQSGITRTVDGRKLFKQPDPVVNTVHQRRMEFELEQIKQNLLVRNRDLMRNIRDVRNIEKSIVSINTNMKL